MKKILFPLCLLLCVLNSYSQHPDIETTIKSMEQEAVKAILSEDTATLKKLLAPDFMVNAPINRIVAGGQVGMVQSGIISYSSFVLETEKVAIYDGLVITMGNETVVPRGSNPLAGQVVKRRYTQIWKMKNGNWVLIARHANIICK